MKGNGRFALFGSLCQGDKLKHTVQLIRLLLLHDAVCYIERRFAECLKREVSEIEPDLFPIVEHCPEDIDMVISIGGDGTFLSTAEWVKDRNIPILGIHTGRLGFLSEVMPHEIEETLEAVFAGAYCIEERSLLEVSYLQGAPQTYPFGLNDIAILKRDTSSMITIRTYVDGHLLNNYQADGLIVSTPTGSTGYSLSVGGPILMPESRTICIAAVAPHSLNVRPIVINEDSIISLEVESRSHSFLVSVDGRSETCQEGTQLEIKRAPYTVKVVKRRPQTFFRVLREKMSWGADPREN